MYKQQKIHGLEKYVDVTCNICILGNVFPTTLAKINHPYSLEDIINIIGQRYLGRTSKKRLNPTKYAFIKTIIDIKLIDEDGFRKDPLFNEYSKYKDIIKNNWEPVTLVHPSVLSDHFQIIMSDELFNVDGMHRIMSAAMSSSVTQLDAYIMVARKDIKKFIDNNTISLLEEIANKCSWFPRYQEIKEVGLSGQRTQEPRYSTIYDFSFLKNKTVVDFGGNIGQASNESYFCGAKRNYNLEYQKEAVETGRVISKILGNGIVHECIDFNSPTFEDDVANIIEDWDVAIYQAIYRTKEIVDPKRSFSYIVDKTKYCIVFEGNADPRIDTIEFYQNLFSEYNFKEVKFLGYSQHRPAFMLYK